MALCCLALLAAIVAIRLFGIPGSSLLSLAAALLCPLMMVFMMRGGMGRGHGSGASSATEDSPSRP